MSLRNATPWNMNVQLPFVVMNISKGVEFGSASVPAVACFCRSSMREWDSMLIVLPLMFGIV
jgi:hypothetical protein